MAAHGPRPIVNMVFIVLLAFALFVAVGLTWDMFQDALSGPGPVPGAS